MPVPTDTSFLKTQLAFAQHIRNPDAEIDTLINNIEPRRLKVYSELFYNNINNFVSSNFPVLNSIINTDIWDKLIRLFMIEHRCKSPIFAEIGEEFIQFLESEALENSELQDLLPEFTLELAYYEWMELQVSIDQKTINWLPVLNNIEQNLSKQFYVSQLSSLGSFSYPVQNICEEFIPGEAEKQDSYILVYRNREQEINFISLAPVAAMLYQNLSQQVNKSAQETIENLHEQLNFNNLDEFVNAAHQIVNDWCHKDILHT